MKLSRPAVAAVVLLIVLLLSIPTTAVAATKAKAQSKSVQTTAARWGAVSTSRGGPATVGGQGAASVPKNETVAYFDMVNVGTEPLSGQLITVSTTAYDNNGNSQGLKDPSQILMACSRGQWSGSGCSGTQVKLVWIPGTLDFTSSVPLDPGERVTVKVTNKAKEKLTFVTTVKVAVSRGHIPSATVTHN